MPDFIRPKRGVFSLVLLVTKNEVALGIKRKKIGEGLFNGIGGKQRPRETPVDCAVREAQEEWHVRLDREQLLKAAIIDFHIEPERRGDREYVCHVHVYLAYKWVGQPHSSREMGPPQWFPRNRLPVTQMMPADRIWLPLVLEGKTIIAQVWYGPEQRALVRDVQWREVPSQQLLRP